MRRTAARVIFQAIRPRSFTSLMAFPETLAAARLVYPPANERHQVEMVTDGFGFTEGTQWVDDDEVGPTSAWSVKYLSLSLHLVCEVSLSFYLSLPPFSRLFFGIPCGVFRWRRIPET